MGRAGQGEQPSLSVCIHGHNKGRYLGGDGWGRENNPVFQFVYVAITRGGIWMGRAGQGEQPSLSVCIHGHNKGRYLGVDGWGRENNPVFQFVYMAITRGGIWMGRAGQGEQPSLSVCIHGHNKGRYLGGDGWGRENNPVFQFVYVAITRGGIWMGRAGQGEQPSISVCIHGHNKGRYLGGDGRGRENNPVFQFVYLYVPVWP